MNKVFLALMLGGAVLSLNTQASDVKSEYFKDKYFERKENEKHKAEMERAYAHSVKRGIYNSDLPNVLLIGDSVTISYTSFVSKAFRGKANVIKNPFNGGPSSNGAENLITWLNFERYDNKWDVIHFNFGLHDIKTSPKTGLPFTSLEDYEKNLRQVVEVLKDSGAKLIFATTTPVGPSDVETPRWLWSSADQKKYNEVAIQIMKENGIEINDLSSFMTPRLEELQNSDGVHFTRAGSDFLGGFTLQAIQKALQ